MHGARLAGNASPGAPVVRAPMVVVMPSKYWYINFNGSRIRTQAYWDMFGDCPTCRALACQPCRDMKTEKAGRSQGWDLKFVHKSRPKYYQGRHREAE